MYTFACIFVYVYIPVYAYLFIEEQGRSEREKWTVYFAVSTPKYYQNILLCCLVKHWQIT